jgi:hypothetical protein
VSSHQGTRGWYKKITECGFSRPRTPADQEQHYTSNITTPTSAPQQQPHHSTSPSQKHHHTIYHANELSNRERFTPPAHHQSTKPAKPKTNMVT